MNYYPHFQQQQPYDPSIQSQQFQNQTPANYYPYSYHQYYVQPQQHQEQEPHPPGVTAPAAPHPVQNPYYQYPLHAAAAAVPNGPQPGGVDAGVALVHPTAVQSSYGGTGAVDGGPPPTQRGAQAHFRPRGNASGRPFRGRGRGKGHGLHKHLATSTQDKAVFTQGPSSIPGGPSEPVPQPNPSGLAAVSLSFVGQDHSTRVRPPPKVERCELCGVECNTLEMLELHRNGKKHQKKLKSYESQKLKEIAVNRIDQTSTSQLIFSVPGPTVVPGGLQIQQMSFPSPAVNQEILTVVEKRKAEEVDSTEESVKKLRLDGSDDQGRGTKHKLRGGKSGRRMGLSNRSKKPAKTPKPKEVIPLICELCNVKCETPVVFQSHLAGKKHLSKAKRLLASQEIPGLEIIKAITPAIQALLHQNTDPSTSIGPQTHSQAFGTSQDAVSCSAVMINQPPSLSVSFGSQNPVGDGTSGI